MTLHRLTEATSRRLCAGQVAVDVESAVKELLENSLDAGATEVNVKVVNGGLDVLEVQDNGEGIGRDALATCALRHFTSKLRCFEDLPNVATYGFRGEALNSLCAVAESVTIFTRTASDACQVRVSFSAKGEIVEQEELSDDMDSQESEKDDDKDPQGGLVDGACGTKIRVVGLFRPLPVRRRIFEEKEKKESHFKKVRDVVISFALIHPAVRFTAVTPGKPPFVKRKLADIEEGIKEIFGLQLFLQLEHITASSNDQIEEEEEEEAPESILVEDEEPGAGESLSERLSLAEATKGMAHSPMASALSQRRLAPAALAMPLKQRKGAGSEFEVSIECWIPKHHSNSQIVTVARSRKDRCFVYVNRRPCDMKKASGEITKAYRKHLPTKSQKYPFMLISIEVPTYTYDVNMTPDKRALLFYDEGARIRKVVKRMVTRLYCLPQELGDFMVQQSLDPAVACSPSSSAPSATPPAQTSTPPATQTTVAYTPPQQKLRQNLLTDHMASPEASDSDRPTIRASALAESLAASPGSARAPSPPSPVPSALPFGVEDTDFMKVGPEVRLPRADKLRRPAQARSTEPIRREVTETATPADIFSGSSAPSKVRKLTEGGTVHESRGAVGGAGASAAAGSVEGDGSLSVDMDIAVMRRRMLRYEEQAKVSILLSQDGDGDSSSSPVLIGTLAQAGMCFVRKGKELLLANITRLDEAILLKKMLKFGRLLPTQALEQPAVVKESDCVTPACWRLLSPMPTALTKKHLRNNGFQVEQMGGVIRLTAVTPAVPGHGIAELHEMLHLLAEWTEEGADDDNPPHPPGVRRFFSAQAVREANKVPNREQMELILAKVAGEVPPICPHGRDIFERICSLPDVSPSSLALQHNTNE